MTTATYTPRLADKYKSEVVPALMKKFGYKSVMQAPILVLRKFLSMVILFIVRLLTLFSLIQFLNVQHPFVKNEC